MPHQATPSSSSSRELTDAEEELQEVVAVTSGSFDAEEVSVRAVEGLRRLASLACRPYRTMCQAEHLVAKTLRQARGNRVYQKQNHVG